MRPIIYAANVLTILGMTLFFATLFAIHTVVANIFYLLQP